MKIKIIPIGLVALLILFLASITLYSSHKNTKNDEGITTFYSNQSSNDLSSLLKNALLDAKHSIFISIFSFTDTQILHALNRQAENGLDITVIYDAKNPYGLKKKLHPSIKSFPKKITSGIMHRKILIIDEREIWIGSTNLTNASLRIHGNLIMSIQSREMAKAIILENSTHLLDKHDFNINDQLIELWLLPDIQGKMRLLELINNAHESLKIAMFTWTDPFLTEAVVNAAKRGVDVEVILDNNSSLGSSKQTATTLASNINFFAVSKGLELLHYKFAYIDGKTLIQGSTNWTRSAFTKNHECHVILEDLEEEQILFIENLWNTLKQNIQDDFVTPSISQKAA